MLSFRGVTIYKVKTLEKQSRLVHREKPSPLFPKASVSVVVATQIFFNVHPEIWGNNEMIQFYSYFSKGLKPPTSSVCFFSIAGWKFCVSFLLSPKNSTKNNDDIPRRMWCQDLTYGTGHFQHDLCLGFAKCLRWNLGGRGFYRGCPAGC